MRDTISAMRVSVLAAILLVFAAVGAFLQASLGGPGTTAFVVRLLLVALAIGSALLLGVGLRAQLAGNDNARSDSNA